MEQEELRLELCGIYRKYIKDNKKLNEMSKEDAERIEEIRKKIVYDLTGDTNWGAWV